MRWGLSPRVHRCGRPCFLPLEHKRVGREFRLEKASLTLGARLEACASFVRAGRIPADIGTDHAYLPIWLVSSGKHPRAYASDINEEPVRLATANIARYGLTDKIITLIANGLEKIPPDDVDDIIIAGMGGDNTAEIIAAAEWLRAPRYRLILQPMSHTERLREYLYTHGFTILSERPVCEAKRVYTVISAEFPANSAPFTELDFYIGRLPRDNPYGRALLEKQAGILLATADGMTVKGDQKAAAHWRGLAEQIMAYVKGEE